MKSPPKTIDFNIVRVLYPDIGRRKLGLSAGLRGRCIYNGEGNPNNANLVPDEGVTAAMYYDLLPPHVIWWWNPYTNLWF